MEKDKKNSMLGDHGRVGFLMNDNLIKARTLSQALPFVQKFREKMLVIKIGGSILETEAERLLLFIQDLVLLKTIGIHPILIHGGGAKISQFLEKLGKQPQFMDGFRVTDPETMDIAQMVLAGLINKNLVTLIASKGGKAVGLSGKDGELALGRPLRSSRKGGQDYGQVGEITKINPELILKLIANSYIPIIAPIATDSTDKMNRRSLNINADTFATEIALALKAEKLIFVSDVPGVLEDTDRLESLITSLKLKEIDPLIKRKVVVGGMIPKLLAAQKALVHGVGKVHLITGKVDHALLVELLTEEGIGTLISK